MRKKLDKGILKHVKEVKAFVPNNIRLSFYMTEVGDVSSKIEFTEQDLDNINLLDDDNFINPELFDMLNDDEGNIYALMDEGVLQGRSTGADLGIYNYEPIKPVEKVKIDYSKYISDEFIRSIDDDINDIAFDSCDDYGFSHCVLAEGNNLGGYNTQIVNTFKGYLEVTKSDFSIIRNCDCDSDNCFNVYVPQQYINKYQLRNGDELVCTCKESKGKMLLTSLFAINQESRYTFNCSRPWFKDLPYVKKSRNLNIDGEYMTTIINKFELFEG
ncbi:MAG: hypothetical protein IJ371_01160, partial [Clostridia bacterium]|nr:hypothetical protein [Clostridia bacterium]